MPESFYEIVVLEKHEKERLDKYLADQLPDISRSRIQQLIEGQNIKINGISTKANYRIKSNDFIQIVIPPLTELEVIPQNIPLNIIFEDSHLLVIDKKAGMVVHPAFGNYNDTLVNALLYHCQDLSGIGGKLRPGIVHRLDKDTSGLLVVAKDDVTHRFLAEQFEKRTIEREYFAIIWGLLKSKTHRIETYLSRSQKNIRAGFYAA